jgi:hypothetical protein
LHIPDFGEYAFGGLGLILSDHTAGAHDDFVLPSELSMTDYDLTFFHVWIHDDYLMRDTIDVVMAIVSIQQWEPPEMMTALVEAVMELNINSGISNALDAKLESALEALDSANERDDVSACNRLQAFINSVEAQRGTHLTDTDADELIEDAQEILTALSCQ